MRRYETIAIIDPDLAEDDRSSLLTRIKEVITSNQGVIIQEDLWGNKKLAYTIGKKPRGFYARYDYCGMGPLVDELERSFRIDDRVMKYLTVQLSPDADVEQIQAEIAAAQAAKTSETATEGLSADSEDPAKSESGGAVSESETPDDNADSEEEE
jgi:small subunit ribosomal protein S6